MDTNNRYATLYSLNKNAYNKLMNSKVPDRVAIIDNQGQVVDIKFVNYGGAMSETEFKKTEKHNRSVFFDKGKNSVWMEELSEKPQLIDDAERLGVQGLGNLEDLSQTKFEEALSRVMANRYYVRDSNLDNVMSLMQYRFGNIINLNFLEDFYINMFKGTAFKTYFQTEKVEMGKQGQAGTLTEKDLEELRKRYNIFLEFQETKDKTKLPLKRYYTFIDDPNPCHLVKIMKDEFGRADQDQDVNKVKYAFINVRELGRGKAGTASLFSYYGDRGKAQNLQIAVKLMASNQFNLTNDAKYLPLRIVYYSDKDKDASIARADSNIRYVFPMDEVSKIDEKYPGYRKINIFDTNHPKYQNVSLACASDNFSNQTILHMVLEHVLKKFDNDNYIKQYDAILCWNTQAEFTDQGGVYNYIREGLSALVTGAKSLISDKATIDGVNFMEIADAGDLHSHLFDIQKQYFSEIRDIHDLRKDNTTSFVEEWGVDGGTNYACLRKFLGDMIKQLLSTMSILQHPRFAFVHGDLKTKNVFVKKGRGDDPRKYIYKIADYDKSSITFNGIRFHNEGMGPVKFLSEHMGIGRYDQSVVKDIEGKNVRFNNQSIMNQGYINEIFSDDYEYDRIQIIYNLIIERIIEISKEDISDREMGPKYGELIEKVIELYNNDKIDKYAFYNYVYKHTETIVRTTKLSENEFKKIDPTPKEIGQIPDELGKCIEILIEINKQKRIDIYYNLNSFFTKLSVGISALESLEFEQLYVRYSPIPFYHTIDLYTLFLSLLQSPMVFTYLKYCQLISTNDKKEKVQDEKDANIDLEADVFWQSFKDIWVDDHDIDTILGYYEYLYKFPLLEDEASIGFILDPIKKNPISLIKSVSDKYWGRLWDAGSWEETKRKLGNDIDNGGKFKNPPDKLNLSIGTLTTMPNICLTDSCESFSMKIHRAGTVFYLNQDMVVYNASGVSEKIQAFKAVKESNDEAIKKYAKYLQSSILDLLKKNENDIKKLGEIFDIPVKININEADAKKQFKNLMLRKTRHHCRTYTNPRGRCYLESLSPETGEELIKLLTDDSTITNTLSIAKKKQMMETMPWFEEFVKETAKGGYKLTDEPDADKKNRHFKEIIDAIHTKYNEIVSIASPYVQRIEKNAKHIIGFLDKKEVPDDIKTYAEQKIKMGGHVGDITNVCRTNIYLDFFKQAVNWDFCYPTEEQVIDILKDMIERRTIKLPQ